MTDDVDELKGECMRLAGVISRSANVLKWLIPLAATTANEMYACGLTHDPKDESASYEPALFLYVQAVKAYEQLKKEGWTQ